MNFLSWGSRGNAQIEKEKGESDQADRVTIAVRGGVTTTTHDNTSFEQLLDERFDRMEKRLTDHLVRITHDVEKVDTHIQETHDVVNAVRTEVAESRAVITSLKRSVRTLQSSWRNSPYGVIIVFCVFVLVFVYVFKLAT